MNKDYQKTAYSKWLANHFIGDDFGGMTSIYNVSLDTIKNNPKIAACVALTTTTINNAKNTTKV